MIAAADLVPLPPPEHLLVEVRRGHRALLRDHPGGRIVLRVGRRTDFDSRRVYWVQRVRDGWAGVRDERYGNHRLAWIRLSSPALRMRRTEWEITVDRSRRLLVLTHGTHVVRRFRVAVGRPGSPTPLGSFSVTDRLRGSGAYGCCILAISATQPKLPRGWTGGNRMAIHGTSAKGSIGRFASAGCVRATDRDLRAIWMRIPLGTPVRIRA